MTCRAPRVRASGWASSKRYSAGGVLAELDVRVGDRGKANGWKPGAEDGVHVAVAGGVAAAGHTGPDHRDGDGLVGLGLGGHENAFPHLPLVVLRVGDDLFDVGLVDE